MRKIIITVLLVLIFLYSCSKKNEPALDWFNKAATLNYTNPPKAIEYLSKAIQLDPNYTDAYNERGIACAQFGQYQNAMENFNEALRLKPDNVNAHKNKGITYFNLGQYQRAIETFNEVIRLQPDNIDCYSDRGIAYFSQGNKKVGCIDAQKACKLGKCNLLGKAKEKGCCR